MSVTEIDSERERNVVKTFAANEPWTHCVVIMEQPPLEGDDPPPQWRVSVTLTLRDPELGLGSFEADLPMVVVGPLIHKRQIVAVAKYPSIVLAWAFRFESDAGRAKALVWLHPGASPMGDCGIFVVPHGRVI